VNATDLPPTGRRFVSRPELDEIAGERLAGLALSGLYVAGSLAGLAAPTVAIVGTRAPSEGGRERARRLAHELGLGGGHDHFFPPRNRELARRMISGGGAVLSPYEPHEPVRPYQFLQRNGIVAALADAVVVVEAAARSGALNTASWAADRSLPVLVFPGDVDRPKVAGCLALIRDGATLVRHADDVLDALGRPRIKNAAYEPAMLTNERQRSLLAAVGGEGSTCEILAERTGLGIGELFALIGECELMGALVRDGDRYRIA